MFAELKKFKKIIVSGPQRSGTRICGKIIAHDLDYRYCDESYLVEHEKSDVAKFEKIKWYIDFDTDIVFQCPALSHKLEDFSRDDTVVIFVKRPINEIINSQKRITWQHEAFEKRKYNALSDARPIAEIKYERWEKQKKNIKHWQEVDYYSLEGHSLWVQGRKGFRAWQTKLR